MQQAYMTKPEDSGKTIAVTLESWGWSQMGSIRTSNQDAFLNWPQLQMWAVADGVGGSDHGGAASQFLTRTLMQAKPSTTLAGHMEQVRSLIHGSNAFLCLQGHAGGSAATTIVVLLTCGNSAACLWAGDSRCYMLRHGVLYQCTRDHTLRQQKVDTGELTAPEAERMIRHNVITNAIGVQEGLSLDSVEFSIAPGDRFLLCSDGLPRIMSAETLSHHLGKGSAKEAVDSIVEALGGLEQPDNITFVAVFVSPLE